jgi:hypothetical protein
MRMMASKKPPQKCGGFFLCLGTDGFGLALGEIDIIN